MEEHQGFLSLVPTLGVLVLALISKKTFESLLGGVLIGYVLLYQLDFFDPLTAGLLKVMQDPTIAWIILVCGLFGSLNYLLVQSGAAVGFAGFLLRFVHNRPAALLATWLMGLSIFIDDYLNALAVGTTMKKITDQFRVPREMLAYIVDSTAAPVCVLIPLSTWAIFVSGLLETNGVAQAGAGLQTYVGVIPFMLYAWIAAIMVPLVALGYIPALGPMKDAETRAAGGILVPPNSESITLDIPELKSTRIPHPAHFLFPLIVLIGSTVWFDIDALKGIITCLVFTIVYFAWQKILSLAALLDGVFEGFKTMIHALAIIMISFVLKDINDELGLTAYILEKVSPAMSRELLPVIAFISLSLVTFATGSFWGVYAIALPIIIPLADSLGVHTGLAIGAVISSGAFGSHACFYGDATVLSASATGCNNMAHVLTQLPYALLAAVLSVLGYLVLGYLI
jgi:Na+/H+ antiporter NhaC